MNQRDRLNRGVAYLATFFGQTIGLGFFFAGFGAGGVFNMRRSTSSGLGVGRCLIMVGQ
jgi:hypothetical protein